MKLQNVDNFERVEIKGKTVLVPYPTAVPDFTFIGREIIIDKALAAWMSVGGSVPLNFRLFGPPGIGKNTIVYELSRILKKDIYIINGHDELGPEDIACSATMTSKSTIEYVASPLFAAMLRGGICFFDEIGKAPQSALDPLASVLDDRRSLTSVLAGIHLKAHPEFLFCSALNEDEETGLGLPGFLDERTRPSIYVGYPRLAEINKILESRFMELPALWAEVLISDFKDKNLSTRMAITLLSYAYRLSKIRNGKSDNITKKEIAEYLRSAYEHIAPPNDNGFQDSIKRQKKTKETDTGDQYDESLFSESKETVH
jgi:MoxR-like ATPase